MSSQHQILQKQVEQLRQEANIQRVPVSKSVGDMVNYMNQHLNVDGLVHGVAQSENPFRDQKSCTIV